MSTSTLEQRVEALEAQYAKLLEMVQEFDNIKDRCRQYPPDLAPSSINYADYTQLTNGDKEVFIRRMLQEALDTFRKRI